MQLKPEARTPLEVLEENNWLSAPFAGEKDTKEPDTLGQGSEQAGGSTSSRRPNRSIWLSGHPWGDDNGDSSNSGGPKRSRSKVSDRRISGEIKRVCTGKNGEVKYGWIQP